ncbi:MAG: serine/threonine protein kinase, partial [Planctomycetaceae bacterium]|nr:serine/threonine protein kinase [Planctomycetaceae bacterium]
MDGGRLAADHGDAASDIRTLPAALQRGPHPVSLRVRQNLGKYRIERRVSEGGFATVYQAFDTIEGVRIALKVPHAKLVNSDVLRDFRTEVRLAAKLEHPHILPLKDASIIDGKLVIAFPLGERSLADRLRNRISLTVAMELSEQLLEAVAHAHHHRIIHCDIKPENCILFSGNHLRLADFGIAKVAQRTVRGAGTGTVGYMAPEQAMGKPSLRSDVFSVGLVIYRMLSGEWPEYPYAWPPPGYARLKRRVHPEMIAFLKRAIDPEPRHRFRDAEHMQNVFARLRPRVEAHYAR